MLRYALKFLDVFISVIRGAEPKKRPSLSPILRQRLMRRQRGKCVYCRNKLRPRGRAFHVDHIIPVSAGGGDEEENLIALCSKCNLWKSDHTHEEFQERIKIGRMKLGAQSQQLSRKLLQQIIEATDLHEEVRRRRTLRLRKRLARVVLFVLLLALGAMHGLWMWRTSTAQWSSIWLGLTVFYAVLLTAVVIRSNRKRYFRWNLGRSR